MKINWKERYEEEHKEYYDLREGCWNKNEKWAYSIIVVLATCFLIFAIFGIFGGFDSPIEKLGLDKNELVREHVLSYYPEFENCSIEYDGCIEPNKIPCGKGIEIYCDKLDSRDNLKVKRDTKPTEILYLDGITLEDILFDIVEKRLK